MFFTSPPPGGLWLYPFFGKHRGGQSEGSVKQRGKGKLRQDKESSVKQNPETGWNIPEQTRKSRKQEKQNRSSFHPDNHT